MIFYKGIWTKHIKENYMSWGQMSWGKMSWGQTYRGQMTLFAKYSLAQILSLTFRGQMGCTPKYLITYFIVEPISGEEQKPINSVESEQCRWQDYFPSNPFPLFNMLLWICLRQIPWRLWQRCQQKWTWKLPMDLNIWLKSVPN